MSFLNPRDIEPRSRREVVSDATLVDLLEGEEGLAERLRDLHVHNPVPDRRRSIAMYQWKRDQQQEFATNINNSPEGTSQEYALMIESLKSDLLSMTHKYLQAQAEADRHMAQCTEANAQIESLRSQLRNSADAREKLMQKLSRLTEDNRRLRLQFGTRNSPKASLDFGPTANSSSSTIVSAGGSSLTSAISASTSSTEPEYVNVDVDIPPSPAPMLSPSPSASSPDSPINSAELVKMVRGINSELLEIARSCVESYSFKAGVKTFVVDNKMVADVNEGIGFLMVQLLRTRDHSKEKTVVELALQTLIAYHILKAVENWSSRTQEVEIPRRHAEGPEVRRVVRYAVESPEAAMQKTLTNVVTVLSLSGAREEPSAIQESCRKTIGPALTSLLKSTETLAIRIREGPRTAEYKVLCARPGSYFNKDFMQKLGASIVKWNLPSSKKPAQVLCTREIGLAKLVRSHSRTDSKSGGAGTSSRDFDVLLKATVVFESDVNK